MKLFIKLNKKIEDNKICLRYKGNCMVPRSLEWDSYYKLYICFSGFILIPVNNERNKKVL